MEYAYSILMGIFAAVLLIYAGIMAVTKNYNMLPARASQAVKPKDPKKYTVKLAKILALTALSPALSALVGLWNVAAALFVLVAAAVLFIILGIKLTGGAE